MLKPGNHLLGQGLAVAQGSTCKGQGAKLFVRIALCTERHDLAGIGAAQRALLGNLCCSTQALRPQGKTPLPLDAARQHAVSV